MEIFILLPFFFFGNYSSGIKFVLHRNEKGSLLSWNTATLINLETIFFFNKLTISHVVYYFSFILSEYIFFHFNFFLENVCHSIYHWIYFFSLLIYFFVKNDRHLMYIFSFKFFSFSFEKYFKILYLLY